MENVFILDGKFQKIHGTEVSLTLIPRKEIVLSNDSTEGNRP